MAEVLTFMLQNLDKPIPMPLLGARVGVSMSHFYYLFKTATGSTPNSFLIRARMRRACELFKGTDLSVKEVAATLGYDDQFYFSRMFKAVSGISPREYRVRFAQLGDARKSEALADLKTSALEPFTFILRTQPTHQNQSLENRQIEPKTAHCKVHPKKPTTLQS